VTGPSRRNLAIGAVVAVVVVAVTMARNDTADPTATTPARRGTAPAAATATMPVADVKLELLQQQRPELEEAERNLFRFQPKAAPPAPAAPSTVAPPSPPPPPAAIVPTGPPPPPPIGLRFIGLVDAPTQAGRIAILSDGRGNIFYGKDGDIIEGRYKVLKVSPDAAELSYLDGRGRQTIRLTGQ
jgi:hypothetical protein